MCIRNWLSFDFGYRADEPGNCEMFVECESDDQFVPLAHELAMVAAERVAHYRQLVPTLEAAAATLQSAAGNSLERVLDAGVACGLVGEADAAEAMFGCYINWFESGEEAEWRSDDDEPLVSATASLTGA